MSGGVICGLIGADIAMKCANTAMGVYNQAKVKGDKVVMDRAIGCVAGSLNDANKAVEKSKNALAGNIRVAREEEEEANDKARNSVDQVEMSPEAAEASRNEQHMAARGEDAQTAQTSVKHTYQSYRPFTANLISAKSISNNAQVSHMPDGGIKLDIAV